MLLQPLAGRLFRFHAAVQNHSHDLIFHGQGEEEIVQQAGGVGALRHIPLAGDGVHRGAAEVRAEVIIPAGQIGHLDVAVHGVRLPSQKNDPSLFLHRACDLSQHPLFTGFHQLPAFQAESVRVDHHLDQTIAVVAGFDAEDLASELVSVGRQVGEVANPGLMNVAGDRQGILCAGQIGLDDLDAAIVPVGGDICGHAWHPESQEYIDIPVFQAGKGHRQSKNECFNLVSQALEDSGRKGCCGGDIGPTHIGKAHLLAGVCRGCGQGGGAQQQADQQHQSVEGSFLHFGSFAPKVT